MRTRDGDGKLAQDVCHEIRDEDVARLASLEHRNLNVLERYSFAASTADGGGLRAPVAPGLDEDDDGTVDWPRKENAGCGRRAVGAATWAMSSTQAMSAQRAAVITRWWLPAAYAPGGVQARLLLMAVKSCSKRLRAVAGSRGRRVSRLRSRTPAGRPCSVNGVPVARVIASDDAVVAVEVAGLECGAEDRAVQLDVVTRREQVLDVAVLDAVAERICGRSRSGRAGPWW
ncbi:hypothetical protein [Streptomyces sp. TE4109]